MYAFVYITASSKEEAERIARHLLEKKLAACVNFFPIRSMYWWEGEIEEAEEYGLIVKTKAEKMREIKKEVREIHSYTVPCICAFGVEDGLREYLDWIDESVQ